jgi:hypothetical protein
VYLLFEIVSVSNACSNNRTYSRLHHDDISCTPNGTLLIDEHDLATFTFESHSVDTSSASQTSPIIANTAASVKRASNSTLSITSLEPIPSLVCQKSKLQNNNSMDARIESISCCDNLHSQWSSSYRDFRESIHPPSLIFTSWKTYSVRTDYTTGTNCDGPFTTLCDGVARAMCSPSTAQVLSEVETVTRYVTSQTKPWPAMITPFPIPRPDCVISPAECAGLWNHLADDLASWSKVNGIHDLDDLCLEEPKPEVCKEENWPSFELDPKNPQCSGSEKDACLRCVFYSETVKLLYWNVDDADELFLCKASNITFAQENTTKLQEESTKPKEKSSIPSRVMTAKWSTFTLTSPTVYAFYTTLKDENGCGSLHSNVLVPVDPAEVSTMVHRGQHYQGPFVSRVDWRHFAYKSSGSFSYPLVPRSAYCGDNIRTGGESPCGTIYHDYSPGLDFRIAANVLGRIDPAWRYCNNGQQMAFDPPIALSPTEMLAKPSLPALRPANGASDALFPAATQVGPFPQVTSPPRQSDTTPDPAAREGDQIDCLLGE